jgi:general secretion pathway protein A
MYKAFYNLSEKPFTLLPDPGFLYMSDKHRMAFTMLEYGLMNNAGFTVISGDIGAGKTTLIRHLLENMDREHSVGLISNTHRSFGELLQWILLAFNLEHTDMNKVEMYQRFVDFIIDEYANNRSTVLIIDEAQNMAAETLEELRMLSNVNADKDQALQVILVGQNELRDTLKQPDMVQLAQRISVDYHLKPLSRDETANYIRHRIQVAGGNPNIFSDIACQAVHRYSNGVPRLINLLCDTALVYGYAEQQQQIGANLVVQVAKEKQAGGIFPTFEPARDEDFPAEEPAVAETADPAPAPTVPGVKSIEETVVTDKQTASPEILQAVEEPATEADHKTASNDPVTPITSGRPRQPDSTARSESDLYWEQQENRSTVKKKVRIGLCAPQEGLRKYLSRLLESYGFDVVCALPLDAEHLATLNPAQLDILLIDRPETGIRQPAGVTELLADWSGPVLYNDSTTTEVSLKKGNPDFGIVLARKINSLAEANLATNQAVNH